MKTNFSIDSNVTAIEWDKDGYICNIVKEHNSLTKGANSGANHNGLIFLLQRLFNSGGNVVATPALSLQWDESNPIDEMELGDGSTGVHYDQGLRSALSGVPGNTQESISEEDWDISTLTAPVITLTTKWDSSYDALSGVDEAVIQSALGDAVLAYAMFPTPLSKTTGGTLQIDWSFTVSSTS